MADRKLSKAQMHALMKEAQRLQELLEQYSGHEQEAHALLELLKPFLDDALMGRLQQPISDIPGGYYFLESRLRKYPDLEKAYADFANRAEGVDMESVAAFDEAVRRGEITRSNLFGDRSEHKPDA
ncbi:MAG: hypothetical protein F9K24_21430 [Leptonema illini]|uniref:Uncharacterized protein n=1 Tax=Leptonema illini TaxID=183 RepID=A0A833GXC1_9LEPT|nr:MAG: hypothetical protein F9K24_21430 [Leptonema illini]